MTTADTLTAIIHVNQLEPGTHISRRTIARDIVPPVLVTLPLAECMECRPDWGQYSPVVTFPAIERALKARGYLCPLPRDLEHQYGVHN